MGSRLGFSGGIKVAVLGWVEWDGCGMETGGVTWWFSGDIKVDVLGWVKWDGLEWKRVE